MEEARELLSVGLPLAEVVAHLRSEFGVSRATAYNKANQAESWQEAQEVDSEGAAVSDVQSILQMNKRLLIAAYKQGDSSAFVRLASAYQKTAAIVGLLPTDTPEQEYYLRMCDPDQQDSTE